MLSWHFKISRSTCKIDTKTLLLLNGGDGDLQQTIEGFDTGSE
jgi:hypothetical protein